jgi:hypothetical protein
VRRAKRSDPQSEQVSSPDPRIRANGTKSCLAGLCRAVDGSVEASLSRIQVASGDASSLDMNSKKCPLLDAQDE